MSTPAPTLEKLPALLSRVRPGKRVPRALRGEIGRTAACQLEPCAEWEDIARQLGCLRQQVQDAANVALGTLVICLYLRSVARVSGAMPSSIRGKGRLPVLSPVNHLG